MPKLSAILIVKNEAKKIRRCLSSIVGWVDEIIILDSGSHDETVSICRMFTPHVYLTDWPGFGAQKNRALNLTTGEWIISLDADEWVRPPLRTEIQQAIQQTAFQGYYIPRITMFCGRFQRYGDASKDQVLRLFQRKAGRFTEDFIHEKVICNGAIGHLTQNLLHNCVADKIEWSAQMKKYAILTAQLRHQKGLRSNPLKAIVNSGWIFFRSFILRQGFRDGHTGWLYAILNAQSSFKKNMHLWRLCRGNFRIK